MGSELPFWKYHGLGNDFVVLEQDVTAAEARALCDRNLGIGADGVLVLSAGEPDETASVKVWNSDGSPAELCGNGMRCATLHVHETRPRTGGTMILGSGAGAKTCVLVEHQRPGAAIVRVDMGRATLERSSVPVQGAGQMIEVPVEVGGRELPLTAVGMGNPHAVTFGEFTLDDVCSVGPLLEHHTLFPAQVNAGFARMTETGEMVLTVWERGAGLTGACGSGACAAAVAACVTNRSPYDTPLVVKQPGGTLIITVGTDGEISMQGPARRAFSGTVDLPLLLSQ